MLDSSALAALKAIGNDLPVDVDGKTFAQVQADNDHQEQEFRVLTERLQRAMSLYNHVTWLLDGAPERISGYDYVGRQDGLAKLHESSDPEAFVEKFEADLAELKRQLDEMPREERMRLFGRQD